MLYGQGMSLLRKKINQERSISQTQKNPIGSFLRKTLCLVPKNLSKQSLKPILLVTAFT